MFKLLKENEKPKSLNHIEAEHSSEINVGSILAIIGKYGYYIYR